MTHQQWPTSHGDTAKPKARPGGGCPTARLPMGPGDAARLYREEREKREQVTPTSEAA